jgi:hypothetical protein
MAIVTTTYRYKPPPKRKGRKLAEITAPAVVTAKGGRRRAVARRQQTAAELTEYETRLGKAGGIQPSTPFGTTSTPANDDSPRRSAIVIVHIRKMVQRQREQAADGEAHRHLHAEAAAGRLDKVSAPDREDGGAAHGGVQHVDSYPPPGGWCTCCWGTRWWTKRGAPYGWCCGTCHPPDHLRADQV